MFKEKINTSIMQVKKTYLETPIACLIIPKVTLDKKVRKKTSQTIQ
jgi:hypothetical protein